MESAIRKALELNAQRPYVYWILGCINLAQSKTEEALAKMQKEPEPTWRGQGLALENETTAGLTLYYIQLSHWIRAMLKRIPCSPLP